MIVRNTQTGETKHTFWYRWYKYKLIMWWRFISMFARIVCDCGITASWQASYNLWIRGMDMEIVSWK